MGSFAAKKPDCKTAAAGSTDFPPGQDSTLAFKTSFEKAGGKVIDEIRMGSPAQVPDFTPFFQRVKDEHPDCFYVFVPSGSHAAGVMKTYGELNMRQTGVRLIGPMGTDPRLRAGADERRGDRPDGDVELQPRSRHAWQQGLRQGVARCLWAELLPGSMSAAGMDTMAGIFEVINTLHGNLDDGAKVIDTLKGWKHVGVRGPIEIDPETRDIVENETPEVIKKPDGKLSVKVLETFKAVKDECKVLKVGRSGSGS